MIRSMAVGLMLGLALLASGALDPAAAGERRSHGEKSWVGHPAHPSRERAWLGWWLSGTEAERIDRYCAKVVALGQTLRHSRADLSFCLARKGLERR